MRLILTWSFVMLVTAGPLAAQGRGGGGGGVIPGGGGVSRSPFDRLVEDLDLDRKTQVPAVIALVDAATPEASALFQQLIPARQALLNVQTGKSADRAPAEAYAALLQQIFALETRVFGDIYAELTPKQRRNAAKGFDRLEEVFRTGLSVPGRFGGPGRMGFGGAGMPEGGQ